MGASYAPAEVTQGNSRRVDSAPLVVSATISNPFNDAFNSGNTQFGVDCGEEFILLTGGKSTPLMALSIEEISNESQLTPGGTINLGDVILYVLKTVWDGTGSNDPVRDGAKLLIRGNRFRVNQLADDGDNCYIITCGPTGAGKINA